MLLNLRQKVAVGFGIAALLVMINCTLTLFHLNKYTRVQSDMVETILSDCSTADIQETRNHIMAVHKRFQVMIMMSAVVGILMLTLIAFFIARTVHLHQDSRALDDLKKELLSLMRNLDAIIRKI